MNSVVHFELPFDDHRRMVEFYERTFGWHTQTLGPEMNNYVLATTTETGADGRPTNPGAINGGFFGRDGSPTAHPSVVVAVDNIEQAMARVTAGGGQVFGEPTDIPGIGRYVPFADTEGNRLSMLEPLAR